MFRKPLARVGADGHHRQMVKLGPLDRCANEVAGDALAAQRFGDARMNQDQTVASASIDQLSFSIVLRPNETVVSGVAHNPTVRLITGHDVQVHLAKSTQVGLP